MFQMYAVASASAIGDSLSADCVLRESTMRPVQVWALTMLVIPPAVVLLWVVVFGFLRIVRQRKQYLKVHLPVSIIVTLLFAHPVVTKSAVKLVACRTVAGRTYLDADFGIDCASDEYTVWAINVALPMFIVFTFGIPLWYLLAMYRHARKGRLHEHRGKKKRSRCYELVVFLVMIFLQACSNSVMSILFFFSFRYLWLFFFWIQERKLVVW